MYLVLTEKQKCFYKYCYLFHGVDQCGIADRFENKMTELRPDSILSEKKGIYSHESSLGSVMWKLPYIYGRIHLCL
jgi:hypothetical protein